MVVLVRRKDSSVYDRCSCKEDVVRCLSPFASCSEIYAVSCFVDFLSSSSARCGDFMNTSHFFVFCEEI
jgi:hypothetical protein